MRLFGQDAQVHRLHAQSDVIGHAVVLTRRLPVVGPLRAVLRGPVWQEDTSASARAEALRGLNQGGLRLIEAPAACEALPQAGYRMVATATSVAWLELAAVGADGADMALANAKWRASLRRARAAGLRIEIRHMDGMDARWLLHTEDAMRTARGYHCAMSRLVPSLVATDADALCLVTAWRGDDRIAAMLFVCHDASATYLMGATTPAGRAHCAHHLTLACAAGHLCQRGIGWLDLGQVDTVASPGLARFKLGSGARLHRLGGSWLRLPFCGRHRTDNRLSQAGRISAATPRPGRSLKTRPLSLRGSTR